MMFESIWILLCIKKPGLSKPDAKVTISADELKSLCSQMYERGFNDGRPDLTEENDASFADHFVNFMKRRGGA